MSANRERVRVFLGKRRVAGMQADAHGDFHQNSLAAAAVVCEPGSFARLGDPGVKSSAVLRVDRGEHQAHALARLNVNDAALHFERFGALGHAHVGGGSQSERTLRVEIAALLAQVAHLRFGFCAGVSSNDFGGGGEGVARIRPAVGSGRRRG